MWHYLESLIYLHVSPSRSKRIILRVQIQCLERLSFRCFLHCWWFVQFWARPLQPNPQNTTITLSDVSGYRGWSPRFSSKESFSRSPRKEHATALPAFVSFKQQHHPERKPLVPRDNKPTWVQRGKRWSINPHPSTTPTGTSWAAWVPLSRACFPHPHMHSMTGCNFAFCIPLPPMRKATLLLKYLWCSCAECLSLSFLSGKWG